MLYTLTVSLLVVFMVISCNSHGNTSTGLTPTQVISDMVTDKGGNFPTAGSGTDRPGIGLKKTRFEPQVQVPQAGSGLQTGSEFELEAHENINNNSNNSNPTNTNTTNTTTNNNNMDSEMHTGAGISTRKKYIS